MKISRPFLILSTIAVISFFFIFPKQANAKVLYVNIPTIYSQCKESQKIHEDAEKAGDTKEISLGIFDLLLKNKNRDEIDYFNIMQQTEKIYKDYELKLVDIERRRTVFYNRMSHKCFNLAKEKNACAVITNNNFIYMESLEDITWDVIKILNEEYMWFCIPEQKGS